MSSAFNPKAKKWLAGRRNWHQFLKENIPADEKIIWMHCASLGEFEQGRPILEKIKTAYSSYKILLTFFSPSGYEAQKNYAGADWIMYLPLDSPGNAKKFIETVNPVLVLFVKYEFWYYFLKKIKYSQVPLLLVSGIFWKKMSFFRWYAGWLRKMLHRFDHLFVQTAESKLLLNNIGLQDKTTVAGDTRFDRVVEIASHFEPVPHIQSFINNSKILVAGSTWPEDEQVLQKTMLATEETGLKLILAPHEINTNHIEAILKLFPDAVLYSDLKKGITPPENARCLVIDNIGMLSRLYHYGDITYIGGGLTNNGVHNVLEAAVHFKPVLFGPVYEKYAEAVGLVQSGGAITFNNEKGDAQALILLMKELLSNDEKRKTQGQIAGQFVQEHKGATEKILRYIQENRLLTN